MDGPMRVSVCGAGTEDDENGFDVLTVADRSMSEGRGHRDGEKRTHLVPRELYDELLNQNRRSEAVELNFAQLAAWYVRDRGYNRAAFREKTLLSYKTYARIMANQIPNPTLETVMALCIGLRLDSMDSEHLLERAGYRLNSSMRHLAYHMLLSDSAGRSVAECNEMLESLGFAPLTVKRRSNVAPSPHGAPCG
jgi:hypothetical protein